MADPSEIGVGTVLGGTYQVESLLGRGGMGTVWSASHMRLPGKRVAVKVLHSASAGDESYARFRREAEIATRIGHPNIVEVIDWNTLPTGTPYLVLELLEGESLAQRIARGPIPLEETLFLVRQLGSALHAAHRAGIVHRDLKPDNIFLCPTDSGGHVAHRVKVLDFGISKIRNSTTLQTQEARVLGTPQYMAPEQARGRNTEVDERTDVFALGAIVYEMIAGRAAFEGDDLATVVFKVVYEEPPPLPTVVQGMPGAVTAAVMRALSKDRMKRQPDVLTFVAEVTGKPLDTLDRAALRISSAAPEAFARTEAAGMAQGTPQASMGSMGSMGSGATPAVTAPPPPTKKSTPAWVYLLAVLAVGGAGAGIAVVAMSSSNTGSGSQTPVNGVLAAGGADAGGGGVVGKVPTTTTTTTTTTTERDAGSVGDARTVVVVVTDAGVAAVDAGIVVTAPVDAGAAVAVATPDAGHKGVKPTKPTKPPEPAEPPEEPEETMPKAVLGELMQAEQAFKTGDYSGAVRIARHSLMEKKTARAYAIIARSFCGLKDLGNAKAALQNVPPRERGRVARRCAAMGFPIH